MLSDDLAEASGLHSQTKSRLKRAFTQARRVRPISKVRRQPKRRWKLPKLAPMFRASQRGTVSTAGQRASWDIAPLTNTAR